MGWRVLSRVVWTTSSKPRIFLRILEAPTGGVSEERPGLESVHRWHKSSGPSGYFSHPDPRRAKAPQHMRKPDLSSFYLRCPFRRPPGTILSAILESWIV